MKVVPGGQRRIDRVLDPTFLDGIDRLDLRELRARRQEAEAEEAQLSYLRRLLHGRLDILRAELERRASGGDRGVSGLLATLPEILSSGEPGRFNAVPRRLLPEQADHQRRRVERLVSDETIARLPELGTDELARAVEALSREEATVSSHRRAVQRVVDALRGELTRRYQEGTAQVADLLEEPAEEPEG